MSSTPTDLGTIFLLGVLSLFILRIGTKKGFFNVIPSVCEWHVPLRWFHVVGVFTLYFVVAYLLSPIIALFLKSVIPADSKSYISLASWINFLSSLLIILALCLYCLRHHAANWLKLWKSDSFPFSPKDAVQFAGFAWILSFPLVLFLTQLLDWITMKFFSIDQLPEQLAVHFLKMTFSEPLYLVLAVITIVFFAPLIEETLFRGYLQTYIRQHLGSKQAIFITSLLFAFFHYSPEQGLGNIPIVGSLFALALFLGICYEKKRTLLCPMTLHAAFNAFSVLNLYFLGDFSHISI